VSVRRLAANQPDSFAFSAESLKQVKWWIAKFPEGRQQSAVIPLLWLVQKQQGWVSEPAIRLVAETLGMPVIRVYEIATFYTMFMLEPVGSHALVQVCGTTPCMLRGANDLKSICQRRFGDRDHLSADGKVTWQEVECLGACSNAPMAAIKQASGARLGHRSPGFSPGGRVPGPVRSVSLRRLGGQGAEVHPQCRADEARQGEGGGAVIGRGSAAGSGRIGLKA